MFKKTKSFPYIIQASSKNWGGDKAYCMRKILNRPTVYWTIKKIFDKDSNAEVVIASPLYDKGGQLEGLIKQFSGYNIRIYYGYDASPLDRMLDIIQDLDDEDYIVRIDGMHCCFDFEKSIEMYNYAKQEKLDCCKFPDDFPVQFTSDIYKVGALREVKKILVSKKEDHFMVHPKYFMFIRDDLFKCSYLKSLPRYNDGYLFQCRKMLKDLYKQGRENIGDNRIQAGDQTSFHYEVASSYLKDNMKVLDIACANGFGTRYLAPFVRKITGADIDMNLIDKIKKRYQNDSKINYQVEDVTNLTFLDKTFDGVISMETIEHVTDENKYFTEIKRILKLNGLFILSTPQNSIGHIPIAITHKKEYSLNEIVNLCKKYFKIEKIIGIKGGRIVIPDDPVGTNTMIICRKN